MKGVQFDTDTDYARGLSKNSTENDLDIWRAFIYFVYDWTEDDNNSLVYC